ncbi:hypothetical protein Tco_1264596 [Tanacetum coccineum]
MGDENPIRTLRDYSKPSHEGYRNTIELPVGNNVDLALYDNESWNDPRDFAKLVKAISLPQDISSTSDRRLIELENQICSGPHDTQYCMEDPEQAFVEYASSRTDEAGGPNRNDDGIEWLDVEEPLDLVNTWLGRDMHIFVGNMSYVIDFTILESSENNIDPSLSNVVFGRPFIEIACLAINRKYGLKTFTVGIKEITFKIPYKDPERSELSSKGHNLLSSRVILSEADYDRGCRKPSDLEDGFYRDTIKLGPEYLDGMDDEGEVTKFLNKKEEEFFTVPGDDVRIKLDGVASPAMLYLTRRSLEDLRMFSLDDSWRTIWPVIVYSTWMAFGGNTCDLGSFGEKTNKITDLHQIHEEVLFTEHGDGVAGIKRCRRDLSSDGFKDLATALGRVQLKEDLESST